MSACPRFVIPQIHYKFLYAFVIYIFKFVTKGQRYIVSKYDKLKVFFSSDKNNNSEKHFPLVLNRSLMTHY